ncbi:MAG TPA: hypothetical protein PKY01_10315 [Candidatus Hydrogenedentes bacterium]|nr:hypothetical protein [Candidatus Hydrogenedentota bacterium]HQH52807.1 hypothetical protein [Candidatus Hydrogenedentota bacterium]HQM48699.1 hypothetical protein [Candidatus Hydrogenedentota bacterium]
MSAKPIKFDQIRDAFDFVSSGPPSENVAFLDPETGEMHFWSAYFEASESGEEEEDIEAIEAKCVAIPHKSELDLGPALAVRFADQHMPESSGKVREIFSRSGAYARFKDLLQHHDMLQQWYDYENAAMHSAVREWCEDHDIPLAG